MENTQTVAEKKPSYIIELPVEGENGNIQIANNVIASIISKNVMEIEGVTRLAPQGLVDGLTTIFSRRGYSSNITIETSDEGAVISVALNMKFGVNIPSVAKEVQAVVTDNVYLVTGLKVAKVNVMVMAIEDDAEVNEQDNVII